MRSRCSSPAERVDRVGDMADLPAPVPDEPRVGQLGGQRRTGELDPHQLAEK
jgi:hypothetical protein